MWCAGAEEGGVAMATVAARCFRSPPFCMLLNLSSSSTEPLTHSSSPFPRHCSFPLSSSHPNRHRNHSPRSRSRPFCSLACSTARSPRDEQIDLLASVHKDHVESIVRILEQAKVATERWEVAHSDFLTPPAIGDALRVLKRLSDIGVVVSGGYPQAERCRISCGHKEVFGDVEKNNIGYPGAVAALSIIGDFMYDPPSHSDFLGSILGTGIVREKVGDILVQGDVGAQVIIVPDLVDYLLAALTQVGKTPVLCKAIPLEEIQYTPPRVQIIKAVEASLRVDALASAGFKMSRAKLVDLISGGDVRVNWKEVTKNGFNLKTGDIISVHHKGRLEIGEISTTRKGKYAVELRRYL